MNKIVAETEAEIDADDPDWRIREQINLYGLPQKVQTQRTSPKATKGMNSTNP